MLTATECAWLRLHLTYGLGRVGLLRLVAAFGGAEAILAASPQAWVEQAGIQPAVADNRLAGDHPELLAAIDTLNRAQVHILTLWDGDRYPALLRPLHDPPAILYLRGKLTPQPALAVVGARRASSAGRRWTRQLCSEIAARGITIVSGLARGIDAAAHEGALEGAGQTIAVLGCGIDCIYPPEHEDLFQQILRQGAILSEYPPGTPPRAGHFPGRNRIISGLSQGVLVVEAAKDSGSLITADFALEQGREVFAVPGPVQAKTSDGVNSLLKDGAHLVTCAADILEVLWPGIPTKRQRQQEDSILANLDGKSRALYNCLSHEPLHIDELARKSGLTPMEVSVILLHLELQGGVEQLAGMRYIRGR